MPASASSNPDLWQEMGGFDSFKSATKATLAHLQAVGPLSTWMVARDTGDYWWVVQVADREYRSLPIAPGDIIHWAGDLSHLPLPAEKLDGEEFIPTFGEIPSVHHPRPAAYVGVPLVIGEGRVFGTLCGFDENPVAADLGDLFRHVQVFGRLLSTIMNSYMEVETEARRAERLEMEAHRDELTGLGNRRAWNTALSREQARADRHAHVTTILSLDLDGLKLVNDRDGHATGDKFIARAAKIIEKAVRAEDVAVRLGGDEFAILCADTSRAWGLLAAQRIRQQLKQEGISVSIGAASSHPGASLQATWEQADKLMYEDKRGRHTTMASQTAS